MNVADIDAFFAKHGLASRVERRDKPPTVVWTLRAAGFPVLIQGQENANRLRIVVFIAATVSVDQPQMAALLAANYHSALDARYAFADDAVVAAFLHPLRELAAEQFVLGFSQAVRCAETYGGEFSGGTLSFGPSPAGGNGAPKPQGQAESALAAITADLLKKIGT